ncbi:MAG: diguanylate cyclase [Azovibrio sp.]|uniref:GGDEF domain-containing protein n=1 Tax=Azovibrio sp. TaxID=1872673 RepID=UPI003C760833
MSTPPLRILLIEDNPGDARLIREILRDSDTPVSLETAETLKDGFTRLENDRFDAILLDLTLPDSQGLETVLRMRQQAPEFPIIILTGLNDEATALQAMREGAQDFLVKGSVDAALLIRAIRYAIERNRMQSALRALSLLDELTGIYNRRGFMTLAGHEMKLAQRRQTGFYLIFIDVDGMKEINDRFGHPAGDQALIATAHLLSETFRGSDVVARMGGDEFAIVTNEANGDGPTPIISRLEAAVRRHNQEHPESPPLSISSGAVFFSPDSKLSLDELIEAADLLMYKNKRNKRACR